MSRSEASQSVCFYCAEEAFGVVPLKEGFEQDVYCLVEVCGEGANSMKTDDL